MVFFQIVFILIAFKFLFCSMQHVDVGQTSSLERIDVETILRAFCRQKHRLDVMECVNNSTQGQALEPWNDCLNPDKELSKEETADLACMLLRPEFKDVLSALSQCVEDFVSYQEAEAWMSILKFCSYKTEATSEDETLSGNTIGST